MEYQIIFIGCFFITIFVMKLVAFRAYSKSQVMFLINTPLLSPLSIKQNQIKNSKVVIRITMKFLSQSFLIIFCYWGLHAFFAQYPLSDLQKSYILAPFVYLTTEFIGTFAQILTLPGKEIPKNLHCSPYLSKNITEFWGKRWNQWVRDWIMTLSRLQVNTGKKRALFFAFFYSGLFHEAMFTLPYYIFTRENYFGSMMLFFSLQFFGVFVDRAYLCQSPRFVRWCFMWIMVLVPIPLFINRPFLEFFKF